MAATFGPEPVSTPAASIAPAPSCGLIRSPTAVAAGHAWMMLKLARTALAHGLPHDATLCIALLENLARTARPAVTLRIRRDLVRLHCALAVSRALAVIPTPIAGDHP